MKKRKFKAYFDPIAHLPRSTARIGVKLVYHPEAETFNIKDIPALPSISTGPPSAQRPQTTLQKVKAYCRDRLFQQWQTLNSQGQGKLKQSNRFSNSWLFTDDLHPKQYKFAIRSRLNLLSANNNLIVWKKSTNPFCTHCPAVKESTYHILSNCPKYRQSRTNRHNKILDLLLRPAIYNYHHCKVYTNECSPTCSIDQLRPDLTIENHSKKKVIILDLTITAQSKDDEFKLVNQRKIDRYSQLKHLYESKGWEVTLDAVVFGDLGGTDEQNHQIIQLLCGGYPTSSPRLYGFRLH